MTRGWMSIRLILTFCEFWISPNTCYLRWPFLYLTVETFLDFSGLATTVFYLTVETFSGLAPTNFPSRDFFSGWGLFSFERWRPFLTARRLFTARWKLFLATATISFLTENMLSSALTFFGFCLIHLGLGAFIWSPPIEWKFSNVGTIRGQRWVRVGMSMRQVSIQ